MAEPGLTDSPRAECRNPVLVAVFALGVSCVITQLTLMREMLGVFAGNEMVLGVALGNWLLLMGLGAALGRWTRRWSQTSSVLAVLLVITAILPPAQVILLRELRQFAFLRGEAIGLMGTVLVSFLMMLPYCLAAGLLLVLACGALGKGSPAAGAGRVYMIDSLGSILGGALFSFVLVLWLDHVTLLVVPAMLNLLVAAWLAWGQRRERKRASTALFVSVLLVSGSMVAWVLLANPDASSTALQFEGQRILFQGNSPYGRLVVSESGSQTNFMENGVVLATNPNIEQAEESVHFAMGQRSGAKRVLLIGGALSGAAREILRYNVAAVDCVELDPLVTVLGRRFLPEEFMDARLRLFEADARQFARRSGASYDVIIVALPDPTTAQLNRYFTSEFYQEIRRILLPGGVLSFAAGGYQNYASPELSRLLSCARQTAAASFRHVLLVPGGRVYFLASDGPLTTDIASALEQSGVTTRWVNRNYLAATFSADRLADLERAAGQPAPLNRDFAPVLYYYNLRHWSSQFEGGWRWLVMVLAAAAAIFVARLRGATAVVFASGFGGSALEIVLLLAMQTLAGSVYRQIAWVVTIFMAGLSVGAWAAAGWLKRFGPTAHETMPVSLFRPQRILCILALSVAGLAAVLPALLPLLSRLTVHGGFDATTQGIILLITFGLAGIVGAQFPLANALAADAGQAASRVYAADFIGAALGAFLTSGWLVPVAGVAGVCWITGGLNLLAALLVFRKK